MRMNNLSVGLAMLVPVLLVGAAAARPIESAGLNRKLWW